MENQVQEEADGLRPIEFNAEIRSYLYETAKWAKMLAIIGFIGIGFMILLGIFFAAGHSLIGRTSPGLSRLPGGTLLTSIIYIVLALLHLFPSLFLYQFSDNTREALDHHSELQMSEAFSRLKSFFKFYGIYCLVFIIFYVLLIIAVLVGGIFFMHSIQR